MRPRKIDLSSLSKQEEKVLSLAMNGLSDKEIAVQLQVSANTIRTYWERIRQKSGSDNRQHLILAMIEAGSVDLLDTERLSINNLKMEVESLRAELARTKLELERAKIHIDNIPIMSILVRGADEIVSANRPLRDYTGLTSDVLISKDIIDRMHPDDLPIVESQIGLHLSRKISFQLKYRFRDTEGKYRPFRYIGTFAKDVSDTSYRTGIFLELEEDSPTE